MAFAVEVGSFTKTNDAAPVDQNITIATDLTAAASGSWAIIFWHTGSINASGTWYGQVAAGLGFAANGGGTVSQYAVGTYQADNAATSDTSRRMAAKVITMPSTDGTGVFMEAEMGATPFPSSTSMRIRWTTNGTYAVSVNYMIISGLTGAKVVNWRPSNGTGAKSFTGAGFQSDLMIHAGSYQAGTVPFSNGIAVFGFGVSNSAGEEWSNSFYSADAVADANTSRWQKTDASLILANVDEGQLFAMDHTSMDADGGTFNVSVNGGGDVHIITLCLDGINSKIGSFTSAASPQTITHSAGWIPKGGLFSDATKSSGTTAVAGANWSLGALDGTNHRAAALLDVDAAATMEANAVWSNTQSLLSGQNDGTVTTREAGTIAFTNTTQMTATWSPAAGSAEFLYVVFDGANTAVGDTIQAIWNVSAAIGDTLQSIWNVSTSVGDTSQYIWNVQAAVGDTVQALWNVQAALGDTLQAIWNVTTPVADTLALQWNVSTAIGKSDQFIWNIQQALGDTVALQWNVAAALGDTLALQWVVQRELARRMRLLVQHSPATDLLVELN